LLCDRRKIGPYGLAGGSAGRTGKNVLITGSGTKRLPSKCSFYANAGAILRIETPGGGGWGKRKARRVRR
jgi:N-methylhydantoinase B